MVACSIVLTKNRWWFFINGVTSTVGRLNNRKKPILSYKHSSFIEQYQNHTLCEPCTPESNLYRI